MSNNLLPLTGGALPRFIGFETLFRDMEALNKSSYSETYPPHNLIKYDDYTYQIELAVAGFEKEELKVQQNGTDLTVSGEQHGARDDEPLTFIHKGISSKKFTKSFKLSEHVEVVSSSYTNGILYILLKLELPEEKKPKVISIQ